MGRPGRYGWLDVWRGDFVSGGLQREMYFYIFVRGRAEELVSGYLVGGTASGAPTTENACGDGESWARREILALLAGNADFYAVTI